MTVVINNKLLAILEWEGGGGRGEGGAVEVMCMCSHGPVGDVLNSKQLRSRLQTVLRDVKQRIVEKENILQGD